MVKKYFYITMSLFLIGCMLSCFSACDFASDSSDEDKLEVIVTIFPPYDFVRQIAGDNVKITQLIPLGSESHTYEPTAAELLKIQKCDLFIYTGGESDVWVEKILSSLETNNVELLTLMSCCRTLEEETVEGTQGDENNHEHEHEHEHELDAHVWTSPKRAIEIVEKIADTLIKLDAQNTAVYEENKTSYLAKLRELDEAYAQAVSEASGDTVIIADRFPFRYLAHDYNIKYFAAFKGCSSDASDPSAATVKFLIDKVNEKNIPTVFYIEFSNQRMADTVMESTSAQKARLHSCHNLTAQEFDRGETYLSLMTANLENLKTALDY